MNTKSKKNVIAGLLLLVCMLVSMAIAAAIMPTVVYAAEPGITLAGSDSSGTGWSYTASSDTLTLNGYNGGYIQGSGLSTLNLVLGGTNTITVDDANAKGIALGNNQNLNISGSGSLTINATGGSNLIYGIECNKFTMTSGTVTINANSSKMVYGINANSGLSVTGGKLTANVTGTSDGRGLYCKTGKLTVGSGAEVEITVTNNGSNNMYGIYNEAYTESVTDNGDIELAGTVTITRDGGSVYGIANSSSNSNTDGVISITGGSVTVTNAYYGIVAFTKGHDTAFADVDISDGTVNITSTTSESLGIVSWNNGVTISGGTVTASTARSALLLFDSDSANKTGLVKITGDAKVSLTSTDYKALIVQGDESTSSTRVHQINLTSGGSVTVKSTSSDESYYAFPVQGYFSLGSSTKITEGSLRSTADGINANGGKLFQADSTTKQVVVAYSTPYTAAGAVSVNGHSFTSDKLYYKNGGADTTGDSTDYNAHYDPATGILELKNYNSGPIIIGGSNAYDLTVKLTGTNNVTTSAPKGGSGNVCVGINITNAENVTFIGDGTLTVNTNAGSGLTQVFGIWLYRSVPAAENLTFQSGKVTVNVTATDTGAQVFGVSTVWDSVGGPITVAEGAELNVTLNSASTGLANGLFSKGDITLNGKTAITLTYTGSGSPNASNWTSVSGFFGDNKLNVGANAAITVDMPDTYSLTNGMNSAYYAAKSDSMIGNSDWTKSTASEQYFENDSFLVTQSVQSGYGYADYKYEVITPLTFEDKADYDIPAGTKDDSYTAAIALTATGGSGEYRYEFEGTKPSDLSINAENKLVYTRSSLSDATTVTVKVTDKGGNSKSITIDIGAVTDAATIAVPANLTWDGTTAKWDAVTGADKYRVILYANENSGSGGFSLISNTDITANSKDFSEYMLPGMYYYFEVAAYNSANQSGTFSGFAYSDKKQMPGSIGTVTGFAWSGNTISWTAVTGATGYDVWVMKNGTQYGSVRNISGTSFDLTSDIASGGEGTYYVSVSAYKLERGNYLAEGNSPAKIIGATPIYSAAVRNVSVNGTIGTAITETQVVIELTNDTFVSALSGNWITNLPAGLSQSVSYGGTTMAIITISGTPTASSTEQIAITIPEDQLIVNTTGLAVTANTNAKFNISAPTYTVTINAGANMTLASGNANQSGLSGAMTDTVYTAADGYYFPTDYAVAAVNGISVTRNSYTQITVSGTPTANTTITLTSANAKTKEATPSAAFTAESEIGGKLTGVDNTMKYSVDGGSNWLDITGDNMAITNVTTANGVQVKKPATDANTKLDSDIQTITVTKAEAPTGVIGVACTTSENNDGKLQNVTTAMQYKKSDASGWTDCGGTEVTGLANGTYYVRVKASSTVLSSDNQTVTVAAYIEALGEQITVTVVGGSVNGGASVTVDRNGTVTVVANPAPEGKTFKGWSIDGGQTIVSQDETYSFSATENVTLTAVYGDIVPGGEQPGGEQPEKTGLSGGAIAGIAVGSVAVAGVGGFSVFWFVIKKKKFADLIAIFKKK